MKKYLVFAYMAGVLAVTSVLTYTGGLWQEVAFSGGFAVNQQVVGGGNQTSK